MSSGSATISAISFVAADPVQHRREIDPLLRDDRLERVGPAEPVLAHARRGGCGEAAG